MDRQLNTRRIVIFLAVAFGFSWAVIAVFQLTDWMDGLIAQPLMALMAMNYIQLCGPALANVATRLITRQGWGNLWLRPNLRRGWRYYLAAWLLPLLATIVGSLAFYLLFPASFDPDVTAGRGILTTVGFASAAQASPREVLLLLLLIMMIPQGLVSGGVVAMAEEFGWRGYLLQRLNERFGSSSRAGQHAEVTQGAAARKAALLVGLIHGVWHWPGFFLGFAIANTYPGAPFLFPLVYLVFTCSMSILLSWATLRSGSAWPAAIGHGTVIGTMALAASFLKGASDPLLGPDATGLIGGIGLLGLALVLYFSRRAFAPPMDVTSGSAPAATRS